VTRHTPAHSGTPLFAFLLLHFSYIYKINTNIAPYKWQYCYIRFLVVTAKVQKVSIMYQTKMAAKKGYSFCTKVAFNRLAHSGTLWHTAIVVFFPHPQTYPNPFNPRF
jgi:hypothetical protein